MSFDEKLQNLVQMLASESGKLPKCQLPVLGEPTEAYSKLEAAIKLDLGPIQADAKYTSNEPRRKSTEYRPRPPSTHAPDQRSTRRGGRGQWGSRC